MADMSRGKDPRPDPNGVREPALSMRMHSETRRISSQHRQLDLFYGMVLDALERSSLQGARVGFVRFRDALDAHISLEDRVFFPALRGLRPEFDAELAALVQDHATIRENLDRLQDWLAQGSIETCIAELDRFITGLAEHEAREEALMARITPSDTHSAD